MRDRQDQHPNTFVVMCCGRRRSILPGGVILCSDCDYDRKEGQVSTVPNEFQSVGVPVPMSIWKIVPLAPS